MVSYDEFLKREFVIQHQKRTIPYTKSTFLCKCGWEGSMFQALHLTRGELDNLYSIVNTKSKEILDNWNSIICPKCQSPKVICIEEAFDKFRKETISIVVNNGWETGGLSGLPISFKFIHKNIKIMHKTIEIHEVVKDFREYLESDLKEYKDTGNLMKVNAIIHILAFLRIPEVIRYWTDIYSVLKNRIKYLEVVGDLYLDNEMEAKWSTIQDEIAYVEVLLKWFDNYTLSFKT